MTQRVEQAPDLTPEDDAILDRIWDRLDREGPDGSLLLDTNCGHHPQYTAFLKHGVWTSANAGLAVRLNERRKATGLTDDLAIYLDARTFLGLDQ